MKKQRGIGLVEIMIAMTIGLVLILGLTSVFLAFRQTHVARQGMGEAQNSQRLAMAFLDIAVRNAGSLPNPLANAAVTFLPAGASTLTTAQSQPLSFQAGQAILGGGANANTDRLSVRFGAESSSSANQGCFAQITPGDLYVDTFSVSGGYLVCQEQDVTAGTPPQTVNLVANVSGLNFLYGVDTAGVGSVSQYMTADQVTAAGQVNPAAGWNSVKTVQATVLFVNPLANQPGQANFPTISLTRTSPYEAGL